jgi:hypothetical protein
LVIEDSAAAIVEIGNLIGRLLMNLDQISLIPCTVMADSLQNASTALSQQSPEISHLKTAEYVLTF